MNTDKMDNIKERTQAVGDITRSMKDISIDLEMLSTMSIDPGSNITIKMRQHVFTSKAGQALAKALMEDINNALQIVVNPYIKKLEREFTTLDKELTGHLK